MDCNECINKIDGFIRGTLNLKESSEFAKHVNGCENCYDELEINYCLQMAVSELSNDSVLTGDFTEKLRKTLENAVTEYYVKKADFKRKRIAFILAVFIIGIFLSVNFF